MRVKYDKNMIPGYQTVTKRRFLTIFGLKKQRLLTISEGGFFREKYFGTASGAHASNWIQHSIIQQKV